MPQHPRDVRVLVVDDEPRMRDLLDAVVREMDFAPPTLARSAEEALRALASQPHDIAVLDLQLPAMHGMDLFEYIRQHHSGMQVIVLTGFGDLDAARRAIRLDVVDFLSKPCHLSEIELALDRARRRLSASIFTPADGAAPRESVETLEQIEKREILEALNRAGGNRTQAAQQLGISRRTLHYRLNQYGIPKQM